MKGEPGQAEGCLVPGQGASGGVTSSTSTEAEELERSARPWSSPEALPLPTTVPAPGAGSEHPQRGLRGTTGVAGGGDG